MLLDIVEKVGILEDGGLVEVALQDFVCSPAHRKMSSARR